MLWTLVLAVLAFDLVHRYNLVSVNETSTPSPDDGERTTRSGNRKDSGTQEIGHLLLASTERAVYRIQCSGSDPSLFLTLTNSSNSENSTEVIRGKFLNWPLVLAKWKDTKDQKWMLVNVKPERKEHQYLVHSLDKDDLGFNFPVKLDGILQMYTIQIDCSSGRNDNKCCLGCNGIETKCEGGPTWLLKSYSKNQ